MPSRRSQNELERGHKTHGVKMYDRGKIARTVWVGNIADQDATEPYVADSLQRFYGPVEKVFLRRKKGSNAK